MVLSSLSDSLRRGRNHDGGFGSLVGSNSEPEPTAMAALALDDGDAIEWLLRSQRQDGSFGLDAGSVRSDDTAIVSLALPPGDSLERALDHVDAVSGANTVEGPGDPPYGWAWTEGAHGWTEPTAWGVLALRRGRPSSSARIDDGLAMLRSRSCVGGGWNYGSRNVFGVELEPFVQPTAVALFSTVGADDELTAAGLDALRRRWRFESAGLLSLATAAAVLRALEDDDAEPARRLLEAALAASDGLDTITLAWAGLALGPGLSRLVVS